MSAAPSPQCKRRHTAMRSTQRILDVGVMTAHLGDTVSFPIALQSESKMRVLRPFFSSAGIELYTEYRPLANGWLTINQVITYR
jgi:hypothetical protein